MLPPMIPKESKRLGVSFVPYRHTKTGYEFYLQKRTFTAKAHPGLLSIFGGGVEKGENMRDALIREMHEELNYAPLDPLCFTSFESASAILHLFIEEVGDNFESLVNVQEGEFGTFVEYHEIMNSDNVSNIARLVIEDLAIFLASKEKNVRSNQNK